MKQFFWLFVVMILGMPFNMKAQSASSIRGKAPVSALVWDLREGNRKALERAFFDEEIDYFLDLPEAPQSVVGELYQVREIARQIDRGSLAAARRNLSSISSYPDQRAYFQAVIQAASGQHRESLEGFRRLIDRRQELSERLSNLAYMGAARVFHEIGDFKQAVFHYNQIDQLASEFFQSIFEKSWSFYLDGDMNGALGGTLAFETPYGEERFYPEAFIVRAASFFQLCYFERANRSIENMKRQYVPLQSQVEELLSRDIESWLFDDGLLSSVEPQILSRMVRNQNFRSAMRAYFALEEEVKKLDGPIRDEVRQVQQRLARRLVSQAGRVLRKIDRELSKALEQADVIQLEILQSGVNVLLGSPVDGVMETRVLDLGSVVFDEKVQFWPFAGEFWLDEVGSYYYGLRSTCGESS